MAFVHSTFTCLNEGLMMYTMSHPDHDRPKSNITKHYKKDVICRTKHSTKYKDLEKLWLEKNSSYRLRIYRAWVGNLKQRVPITSKSSKFKGAIQHYVVKLSKSAGTRHYCPKIQRVPGTLGTRANSSPALYEENGLRMEEFQNCWNKDKD